jgi:glutathione S-transferase/alpha,alpha-trehalase
MFESGAILAYLADAYGGLDTPQKRAAVQPWLVWANASLDPCVFKENERGQVIGTGAAGKAGEVCALTNTAAHLSCRPFYNLVN